jgi:hypothetical protein
MTVAFDPSGFQMKARLRTVSDVWDLWIGGGESESGASMFNGPAKFKDVPIVSSIQMEINLGLTAKVTIGINATYEMGLALLDSQLFVIGNTVEVQIGYPRQGIFTPWYGGITAKPSIRISADEGLIATLNVEGGGFSSLRTSSNRQFRARSYLQIIQEIASLHAWNVITFPSYLDTVAGSPMNEERSISQGNFTDWRFIQTLCRSGQCDAFLQPDPNFAGKTALVIRERGENPQPRLKLNARGQSDFLNTFPLFTFESDPVAAWLPRGSGNVRCADVDPDSRVESEVEVDQTTTSTPRTADATAASGGQNVGNQRVELRGEPGPNRLGERLLCSGRDPRGPDQVVASHSDEQQASAGFSATCSTFGIPYIFPGDFVQVINIGVLSGNFGVQGVTQRAEPGMWTTVLELKSNAIFSEQLVEILQDEVPITNSQEAEETPEVGSGAASVVEVEPGDPTA